jgi:hypothetical protein
MPQTASLIRARTKNGRSENRSYINVLGSPSACACEGHGALQKFLLQTELKADKSFIEI